MGRMVISNLTWYGQKELASDQPVQTVDLRLRWGKLPFAG